MTRYAQRTLIGQPGLANWGKAAAGGIGVVQGYGIATGGTSSSITDSVAYTLLSFTTDGTLVVSNAGLFDVLLVGGGGGGSATGGNWGVGAGGGGGGVFRTTVYLDATSYAVTVGSGGAASQFAARGNTSLIAVTATLATVGGLAAAGGGPSNLGGATATYNFGASGGGTAQMNAYGPGAGITGQGFAGGARNSTGTYTGGGGGGGGASAVGGNASGNTGGTGGAGQDISTFIGNVATTNYKGGGGGGGGSGTEGTAGIGNGAANSGGGGRGSTNNTAPVAINNGYSGVVYVRFKV